MLTAYVCIRAKWFRSSQLLAAAIHDTRCAAVPRRALRIILGIEGIARRACESYRNDGIISLATAERGRINIEPATELEFI